MAHPVPLDSDEVLHGTLHGTVLHSVVDGTLNATNLLDGKQSWSVDLSGGATQEYLGPPAVLGDTVLTVTAENLPPDPNDRLANPYRYVFNASGVNVDTGTVLWKAPIHSGIFVLGAPQVRISERDGAALVALTTAIPTSDTAVFLLDPGSGEVLWRDQGNLVAEGSGPYAMVLHTGYPSDVLALDLRTGQTSPLDKSGTRIWSFADIYGDESYAVVQMEDYPDTDPTKPASSRYVRFSSTDGTSEPITIPDDDTRHQRGVTCAREARQPVTLCQDSAGVYGVDPATGQKLWEHTTNPRMEDATQYHGTVYAAANSSGVRGGTYQAVSLQTGEITNPDLGIHPIPNGDSSLRPIKVNQYGAIGALDGQCVWVPASS